MKLWTLDGTLERTFEVGDLLWSRRCPTACTLGRPRPWFGSQAVCTSTGARRHEQGSASSTRARGGGLQQPESLRRQGIVSALVATSAADAMSSVAGGPCAEAGDNPAHRRHLRVVANDARRRSASSRVGGQPKYVRLCGHLVAPSGSGTRRRRAAAARQRARALRLGAEDAEAGDDGVVVEGEEVDGGRPRVRELAASRRRLRHGSSDLGTARASPSTASRSAFDPASAPAAKREAPSPGPPTWRRRRRRRTSRRLAAAAAPRASVIEMPLERARAR